MKNPSHAKLNRTIYFLKRKVQIYLIMQKKIKRRKPVNLTVCDPWQWLILPGW